MKLSRILVGFAFFCITACATTQPAGTRTAVQPRYDAPDQAFSIAFPEQNTHVKQQAIAQGWRIHFLPPASVDTPEVLPTYLLEWRQRATPFASDAAFFRSTDAFLPQHIRQQFHSRWAEIEILHTETLRVAGHAAHQYFGTANQGGRWPWRGLLPL